MSVAWLLGDPIEALAILGVLVINAAIGFVTELRAREAMAALLALEVPRATVVRDGRVSEVDATALVPGDIILLAAGQSVPADRKSTRLNSSHVKISYAVFCLKKKTQ